MSDQKDNLYKHYDIVYGEWMGVGKTLSELELIKEIAREKNNQPQQTKILDIGCGSGRNFIPLFQEGFDVEGIDLSQEMLKNLIFKIPNANVHQANILEVDLTQEQYDLVYLLWNAFGEIALTEDSACRLLHNIHQSLKPGGMLLFDHSDIKDRDIPDGLNLSHHIHHLGLDYYLTWHVDDFDPITLTTNCLTLIEVEKDGQIIDQAESSITQRWWRQEEIESLVQLKGFSYEIKHLDHSDYLYFVLTK